MRHLFLLYKVELKKIRPVLVGLPLMYGIVILYLRYVEPSQNIHFFWSGLVLVIFGTIFVSPAMLAFSMNDELKFNTVYQLCSLSCRRYTLLLSKYLTAITVCFITTIGTAVCLKQMEYSSPGRFGTRFFLDSVFATFTNISWITGMTCLTAAIVLSIKRHRPLAAIMLFVTLIFLNYKMYDLVKWLGDNSVEWPQWTGKNEWNSVMVVIGIVYVIIGHIIYEKYAEI